MFKIFYEDGSVEVGKSTDGSWKTIQNPALITKLEYNYTWSRKLVLQNYKEYNHLLERVSIVGGLPSITKIFIMGRLEDTTDIFTVDLQTRLISKRNAPIGQEYNGQVVTGWKNGLLKTPGWDDGQ